jgi:uncharacterized protein (TIGR03000 family)
MLLLRFLTPAVPAVTVVALLFAPGVAQAGGGGHGGGGGYHGGYGGYGGYHGSSGGYHGSYGGYHGGYGYGFGVGIYLGGGYPYGYPGGYLGYPPDPDAAPYLLPATPLAVAPPVPGPTPLPAGQPGAGGLPPAPDLTAHVAVTVPADAEVWFGQGKTRQGGVVRQFVSPELAPGREYTYEIKARWVEGGHEVVQTRQLVVSAGAWKAVDFTRPAPELVGPPVPKP